MGESHKRPDLEEEFAVLMDASVDNELTPEEAMFLLSIRMAEQGPAGFEFGVKSAKGSNLRRQAGEAAASILKNRPRYDKYLRNGGKPNYTVFFAQHGGPVGNGWAPIKGVPEPEAALNANWPKNADHFLSELLPDWMPRIKEFYSDAERQQEIGAQQTVPLNGKKTGK